MNNGLICPPTIVIDKSIVEEVQKLQIAEGDIMLIRCPANTPDDEAKTVVQSFREWTRQCGCPGIRLLCIIGDTQIDALDEARMLQYGWVREKGYGTSWRS